MVRFFVLFAAFFVFAAPATAQTLVQNPPVYKLGEHYSGTIAIEGEVSYLHQRVEEVSGKVAVVITATDAAGSLLNTTILDPLTWLSKTFDETGKSDIVATTCSADGIYPIYLGKKYHCSSIAEENGETVTIDTSFHFNEVERGRDGGIIGVCNTTREIDKYITVVARTCHTPDGKFIRSTEVLDYFSSK